MNIEKTLSTIKNESKEVFVIRLSLNNKLYLQDVAWVGTYFKETYSSYDFFGVAKDVLNHKRSSDNEDTVLRFNNEEEAKNALIKVFNSYYKKNKKDLPQDILEIVRVKISVEEEVVNHYNIDEVKNLGNAKVDLMLEFEEYFSETPFAKGVNISLKNLEEMRKSNLTGYKEEKINIFFNNWIELNNK